MIINLIAAAAANNTIGTSTGDLPWSLPNDLKRFKRLTIGGAVIMGNNTFKSLKGPLKGRLNIVLTRDPDLCMEPGHPVEYAGRIERAIRLAKALNYKQVWIIGGGEIYRQTIKRAHYIYLTRIKKDFAGPVKFPEIPENFKLVSSEAGTEKIPYNFELYLNTKL